MGHVVTSPGLRKLTADETIPNLKDLSLILYDFLQAEACPELIWLLIDLDQAVIAYQWFLDILMTIADGWESNFKIMVVGNLERNLIQIGAGLQIDYLEPNLSCNEVQLEEKPTPISSGHLDQNTSKPLCRLLETPELLNLQPELNQIFNDLSDPDFLQALQSCLPSLIKNKGVNYAKTALSRLRSGFSVTSFLDQIIQIGSLLTTQDNTSTAAQVLETLEMVIFSLRPLAADELVDLEKAARQWDPSRHERSLDPKSVTSWLPGILILQENEVLFSHRLLRDRILSVDSPVAHFRSGLSENHEFHNGIVKLCLRYLSSPYGGDRLASYTSLGRPSSDVMQLTGPESRQNFLSYAVKYWPIHAKLAGPNLEIFGQPIQEFLGNQDLLNKWALAFWAHQGQGSGHLTGPYAILAQHGLLTMIQEASLKSDHTFGDDQDSQHAFLAAASTGNEAIIGFLAPMVSLNSETFNRAAVALLEFGIDEFAMSSPLSERMAFPNDHGTMALLCRAAFLDEHILIHHVLSIPPSENTQIEINLFGQLLSHACQGGSVQTVKFLLKHRAQEISNKKLLQAMALTVPYSHLSVAKLLAEEIGERMKQESLDIAQGAEAAATDPDKVDLLSGIDIILQLVISRGHYKILQAILDILQPKTSISCLSLPLLKRSIFLARVKCFNVLHEMFIGNHLTIHAFSFKEIISLLETVVQRGEVSILRNLINVGVPFDREFFSGCFAAAINHRYKAADVVDLFISVAKENLDEIALIDELTLHLASAVKSNLPDITKLLIQGGADIDRHTLMSHTRTPLFHAVFEGHLETVIIILSVQPKPDIRSKELHPDGWEPIHAAADNLEILQLLIENKADVNAQTTNGSTALFLAVKWGKIACVKELLRHKPRLDLIVEDNSLLSVGIEYGSEMIELLLDAGVYPCHKDALYANSYLLHECVKNNMLIGLRRLLLFTLPLDQRDEDGRTPLNCLHSTTSVDIVKLLVHRGASPDTIDFSGVSVLFKAVEFGHLATVKFLLSQGVAPDALGGQNETAIHFACINSSLEMVRLLVENCHSLDKIHDGSYGTAFQAACRRYDVESKKELLTYILDTKKVPVNQTSKWWGGNLQMACLLADTTVIQRLLDRGERADEVDRFRRQPIHFASYRTAEHVKILRGKNADILAEDIMHRSVLHFAVSGGNLDLIKYILDEHRELLEQGDCDGWTPIFWALRPRMHWDLTITGRKKIIEELIERGADLERVSAEGKEWTLRQLAQYYGLDQSVVDMFPYKEEYIDEQKLPISKAELNSDGGYCDACLLVRCHI
ncbi:hypothetical protein N7462_006131 [Penicillium macrosclerotiorum]|uniref:uncharacterized protein n=1 Tax=Penicillium macrosclerotiorum TaxID=303699 RepID=UPI0025480C11|nr:uncharacterized protein N7462_006131 [Penicillium macrosclerotiorum]KAJ5682966.1 hypothetical protein N7462_006131 [Penicillium macrosclerotiorum]